MTILPSATVRPRRSLLIGLMLAAAALAAPALGARPGLVPSCALLFLPAGPTVPVRALADYATIETLATRKAGLAHPEVPSATELSICPLPAKKAAATTPISAGVADPFLERARTLGVFEDYKPLSDLRPKRLSAAGFEALRKRAIAEADRLAKAGADFERAFLKLFIESAYEPAKELASAANLAPPRWKTGPRTPKRIADAFDYTERTWAKLLVEANPLPGGSLLPTPYPILVPAGRFQEAYYWDTYFGMKGLFATGRLDIARMQVENLLEYVRRYGFVPNGGRDYYLSRSQPPFLSSMVREVFERSWKEAKTGAERTALRQWLRRRAYPLVKRDYEDFWMNPKTRFDAETGLNHHWDDVDGPRPERHGADDELAIGKTYRDTRAGAESGLDFTDAFEGEPTKIAGPLLNSMLYKTESDLAWMSEFLEDASAAARYREAADRRKRAMRRLWNAERGRFEPYHLGKRRRVEVLSADGYAPLFVGLADDEQAKGMRTALKGLEKPGGVMASDLVGSHHQWDGTNGWAPYQVMAIEGLRRYGYAEDATRLARKWVDAVAAVHAQTGVMVERIDVSAVKRPDVDPHKYPTQEGFLWTNGSFVWAAVEILHVPIVGLAR